MCRLLSNSQYVQGQPIYFNIVLKMKVHFIWCRLINFSKSIQYTLVCLAIGCEVQKKNLRLYPPNVNKAASWYSFVHHSWFQQSL